MWTNCGQHTGAAEPQDKIECRAGVGGEFCGAWVVLSTETSEETKPSIGGERGGKESMLKEKEGNQEPAV